MIKEFEQITTGIITLMDLWEEKLLNLPVDVIAERRNSQNRTIKQILGHLIDSASNNTHRIVHLQYQTSPVEFPNYASNGNNDKWIAIQNFQDENWENLIQLLKYMNWHLVHVIKNINPVKLENEWIASPTNKVILKAMVVDYLGHFELHFKEINDLINQKNL